jgi:hypothetical protein
MVGMEDLVQGLPHLSVQVLPIHIRAHGITQVAVAEGPVGTILLLALCLEVVLLRALLQLRLPLLLCLLMLLLLLVLLLLLLLLV